MIQRIKETVDKLVKNQPAMIGLCLLTSVLMLCLPSIMSAATGGEPSSKVLYPWVNFLGNFHPLVLHLPIGALLLVFSIEIIGFINKEWKINMTIPLIFNALTSILACVLGLFWYYGGEMGIGEMLDSHMWQGLIFSVCAIWLPLIYNWFKNSTQAAYYVALVGSVVIMSSASHIGGELVHEGGPFAKAPWKKGKDGQRKNGRGGSKDEDPVFYAEFVQPIFAQKCYSCHHSSKKKKSGFKMDTLADIKKGGDNQEFDTVLTPGDVSKSFLIGSIELPEEDDLHMPPKKKTQITKDELAILKFWVSSGASDTAKLSELKPTPELLKLVGSYAPVAVDGGNGKSPKKDTPKVTPSNSPLAAKVKEFGGKYPNALVWTSMSDSTLYFSAASLREKFTDTDLVELKPFVSELSELNLNATSVTDEVADLVNQSPKLMELKLAGTKVTDALLKSISSHPSLELIILHSTEISDKGLEDLAKMPNLKKVFLWQTKVTKAGVDKLIKALPECEINSEL